MSLCWEEAVVDVPRMILVLKRKEMAGVSIYAHSVEVNNDDPWTGSLSTMFAFITTQVRLSILVAPGNV